MATPESYHLNDSHARQAAEFAATRDKDPVEASGAQPQRAGAVQVTRTYVRTRVSVIAKLVRATNTKTEQGLMELLARDESRWQFRDILGRWMLENLLFLNDAGVEIGVSSGAVGGWLRGKLPIHLENVKAIVYAGMDGRSVIDAVLRQAKAEKRSKRRQRGMTGTRKALEAYRATLPEKAPAATAAPTAPAATHSWYEFVDQAEGHIHRFASEADCDRAAAEVGFTRKGRMFVEVTTYEAWASRRHEAMGRALREGALKKLTIAERAALGL